MLILHQKARICLLENLTNYLAEIRLFAEVNLIDHWVSNNVLNNVASAQNGGDSAVSFPIYYTITFTLRI